MPEIPLTSMSNDVIRSPTDRFLATAMSSPTLKLEDTVAPLSKSVLVLTERPSPSGYSNLLSSHELIADIYLVFKAQSSWMLVMLELISLMYWPRFFFPIQNPEIPLTGLMLNVPIPLLS